MRAEANSAGNSACPTGANEYQLSQLSSLRHQATNGQRGPERTRHLILAAADRLLKKARLHELSVTQIIDEAQVSRPTFYSYFESKLDVVWALFEPVILDFERAAEPLYDRPVDLDPVQGIEQGMTRFASLWTSYGTVLATVVEFRHIIPQLQRTPPDVVVVYKRMARQLDRDRSMGLAPPGPPSKTLLCALVRGTEQVFYKTIRQLADDGPDAHSMVPMLTTMWLGALYPSNPPITDLSPATTQLPQRLGLRRLGVAQPPPVSRPPNMRRT